MRYVAFAVDLFGVARATYEIDCANDADARCRAERFLDAHPAIEVWHGVRRVARLTRDRTVASGLVETSPTQEDGDELVIQKAAG
jgi:hypothetical protein